MTGTGKGSPGKERSHGNQHGRGWLTVTNSMTSCQGGPRIKLKRQLIGGRRTCRWVDCCQLCYVGMGTIQNLPHPNGQAVGWHERGGRYGTRERAVDASQTSDLEPQALELVGSNKRQPNNKPSVISFLLLASQQYPISWPRKFGI